VFAEACLQVGNTNVGHDQLWSTMVSAVQLPDRLGGESEILGIAFSFVSGFLLSFADPLRLFSLATNTITGLFRLFAIVFRFRRNNGTRNDTRRRV
jgi:hypothetical protein